MFQKINLKLISPIIISLIIFVPFWTFAQDPGSEGPDYLDRLTGVGKTAFGIDEPATPQEIIVSIINIFLGLLAIFFIIQILISGYQWMFSGGNEEKIKHAHGRIMSSLIGVAIIVTSLVIVNFILAQLVGAASGTPWFGFSIGS